MDEVNKILLHSAVLFLILGGAAGIVAGLVMLVRPEWLMRLGKLTNRWISTRRLDRSLETNINLDHWFYRNSRVTGALTLAGAAYIIYFIIASSAKLDGLSGLFRNSIIPAPLMDALLDALVLILLLSAMAALIISLFLLFRPSLLRGFEQKANQTSSLRRALKPLEIPRSSMDEFVFRHAPQVGVLLVLGGVYTVMGLMAWLG